MVPALCFLLGMCAITERVDGALVGAADCVIPDCSKCGSDSRCVECRNGTFLYTSPLNGICMFNCPQGYFKHISSAGQRTCQSCASPNAGLSPSVAGVPNCKECNLEATGKIICLACNGGHKLSMGNCLAHCLDTSGSCANDACNVILGERRYCSKCDTADGNPRAPIDGVCSLVSAEGRPACVAANGVCISCEEGYFLHEGGCYNGQLALGRSICAALGFGAPNGGTNYGAGMCNRCADGYRDAAGMCSACKKPHCKVCARGVDTCQVCTKESVMVGVKRTRECLFFAGMNCKDRHCARCSTSPDVCDVCEATYFQTPVGTCTTNCELIAGHFPNIHTRKCERCRVSNCVACSSALMCEVCVTGFGVDRGQCKPCSANCYACSTAQRCTVCSDGYILYGSGACLEQRAYVGSCEVANVAYLHHIVRVEASGLEETVILRASLCSQCRDGYVPINGRCVAAGSAAAAPCTVGGTTGRCEACSGNYFYKSGGCYAAKGPVGATFCRDEAVSDGTCRDCASGCYRDGAEGCVACADGCLECPANNYCVTCALGYTLSGNTCVPCDSSCTTCNSTGADGCTRCRPGFYKASTGPLTGPCHACDDEDVYNGWRGVAGCRQCTPHRIPGPVLCLSMESLDTDPGSRLSTAKIVGIVVPVVLLVAGVGGFLAWWLLRRRRKPAEANISLMSENVSRDVSLTAISNM